MRLRLRSFLLTSALTFAPALASATTISGIYVDGGAGYNEVQDQHVHANSSANGDVVPKFSVNHGTGYTGFGAVGWGFGNGLRVEAEGLYNFSHDNYMSYEKNTDSLQKTVLEKFGGYTAVRGAKRVTCQEFENFYNDNGGGGEFNMNTFPTGNPETNGYGWTTTASSQWNYVPVDISNLNLPITSTKSYCYLLPYNSYTQQAMGSFGQYNGWNGTNADPGVYVYPVPSTTPNEKIVQYGRALVWKGYPYPPQMHTAAFNHNGSDESWGGFANVLYDFDLERLFGIKSIVTPFVGGGAGYLWQRYNRPNTMIAAITGTHGGFSWQGIAGVAFDTGISGLQITAQYRMIGQPGSFYNGSFNYGTEGGHANFDQRFNHQFIVGFRYAFQNRPIHHSQPPAVRPIVAAAPVPVPARSYLVFFDWNQYALTSRARQIVVEAAHATSYVHTTRINVNGYTDSSAAPGPAGQKYNYALSVKRARSVEAELIRNGVPASEIVIRGYGDTNPLVPTAPNTREPQNRRVEIILHA